MTQEGRDFLWCHRSVYTLKQLYKFEQQKGTKTIETERLILRAFRAEDAEAMFRNWASDPEVTKFLTWPAHGDVSVTRHVLADWVGRYGESS